MFDATFLLSIGVTPAYYYDTAAMARGLWPDSRHDTDVAERVFPITLTCV